VVRRWRACARHSGLWLPGQTTRGERDRGVDHAAIHAQGIHILRQARAPIVLGGETLNLIGIDDHMPKLTRSGDVTSTEAAAD